MERPEYTGCTVNFKTYSKSHKLKKRLQNAPENYRIFPDTQPAIINEKVWERVQELRANKRRPAKQAERQGLFSGLLYCADCGSKLHFATGKNMTPEQDCYRCARYKSNTGDCTMHFIREETLKRFVLRRIFDVTAMFFEDIMSFQKAVYEQRFEEAERAAKKRKREIAQAEKRIAELDRIFKRIYEDDISGAISHERFLKLSAEYEAEQKELTEKVKADREMVNAYEQDKADFDSFAAVIRKYVGITELTPTIVNEFVKKIIVHAPDKSSGHRRQKIQIIWNFVGELKQDEDKQTIERNIFLLLLLCLVLLLSACGQPTAEEPMEEPIMVDETAPIQWQEPALEALVREAPGKPGGRDLPYGSGSHLGSRALGRSAPFLQCGRVAVFPCSKIGMAITTKPPS